MVQRSSRPRFVAVAGNIGAGKSELVGFLARRWGAVPSFEPNEQNPYLDDFYADMERWAFHSQLWFLSQKAKLHRGIQRSRGLVLQDRTIYEDAEVFARNLFEQGRISARDWDTYAGLYETLRAGLKPPDLLVYLRASVPTLRKRIRRRGRASEQDLPTAYLRRLGRLYESWLAGWRLSPVLVLETDDWDYRTDLVDRLDLVEKLDRAFAGARRNVDDPSVR